MCSLFVKEIIMFEKMVSKVNGLKGLLTDFPQGKELPSMQGVFNEEVVKE